MFGVALTSAFVVIESLAGWFGHSLALMSDAGHNLADVLALLVSWYALKAATAEQRTADLRLASHRHLCGPPQRVFASS